MVHRAYLSLPQEITFYRKVDLEQKKNQGQHFNAAVTILQATELFW